ncbi:MAG: hypothetical protein QOH66_2669, partial [Actinomycetota bacterium]|nr:hypothetical protein [Actinomycetota bacterium]
EVYQTQVNDVLLGALGSVLSRWTGRDDVLIGMEGHGREDILERLDTSRTVGWFTSEFPVALSLPRPVDGVDDWGVVLKSVKEQLRAVPHRGLSYGALRYLSPPDSPAAALREDPSPQILFNYHGQWNVAGAGEGLYRAWGDGIGQDISLESPRTCLLEIVGVIQGGELELAWTYSGAVHDEATVRRLATGTVQALREIVAHCARPDAGGRSPSDFPLAHLDQRQVDAIAGDGRGIEDIYPLTPLQAGMLFHALVDAEGRAYHNQLCVELSGVSDPRAFGMAWQRVVDRTPILRSSVVWEGVDEPLQVVHREVVLPVVHHDWRHLSAEDAEEQRRQVIAADHAAGMDLTLAPLMRLVIAQLSDDEILLVWTSHHVFLDGWSTGAVFTEVCEQYAAIVGGRAPRLPARRPFRDYLQWLDHQDRREAEEHWRRVLSGFDSPIPLPYDRQPAEAHRAESSESMPVELSPEQSLRLHGVARRSGLTLNTIVQGAWALLLARYSGERDVVFGTTVSGRPAELPGVESMVGMFINTIPTRVGIDEGQSAVSWLRALQDDQVESRNFDFVSLAQLQSWSDVPGGTNLFDTMVVFENYPIEGALVDEAGLAVRDVQGVDTTNFPLTLSASLDDRLRFDLEYDPKLFDPDTAERMVGHLQALLEGIAADPDLPIAELPLLGEDERRRVLVEWNDTALEVPAATFPGLFEAQVRATPDEVALVFGDRVFSFLELNAAANRLAHHLIEHGVGPEEVVALALPRSADMVVGILAVLKAGGVYLPVDPELPVDRIAFVVQDAAPVLVVTTSGSSGVHDALSEAISCLLVDHPDTAAALEGCPDTDPTDADRIGPLRPESTAYVIYTSGSTGRPKGVMVEHRSLVNLLHNHRGDLAAAGGRRVRAALTAAFSFDASWEQLVLMADGHELHLIDEEMRLDPHALVDYVAGRRIDFLDLTPSYLHQLIAAGLLSDDRHRPPILMLGGEALGESLWRELAEAPGTTSYNFYGPTECTVDALSARVRDSA